MVAPITIHADIPLWVILTATHSAAAIVGVILWAGWESFRKDTFGD